MFYEWPIVTEDLGGNRISVTIKVYSDRTAEGNRISVTMKGL
ncbi:hypothetical protein J2Y03_002711 [Neobacillus niacini]|nr:hypothetical protein [Neobacillus niacini]